MENSDGEIAGWIRDVHSALAPATSERAGATWGPVTVRHRTTRSDWFGGFDRAWAEPTNATTPPTLDIVSASLDDLPTHISPPRIVRGTLGTHGEVSRLAHTSTRMTWNEPGGEIAAWDPESSKAVLLRAGPPPWYDQVSPFRWFVHWSVAAAGGALLHAACVGRRFGDQTRGVLVLGEATYGKSTTALACVTEGWVTCGDDSIAVFPDDTGWHARPVYAAIKTRLAADGAGHPDSTGITSPAALTWDVNDDKRVHLLSSTEQPTLAARIDIDALVLLRPDAPADEPWQRISDSTARTLVAPSTTMPLPFDRNLVLERIGQLTSEIPAYSLPRRPALSVSVSDVGDIAEAAQPRISVVVPLFDGERYIEAALSSIVEQSVGRFQIVVVDDASPDDSVAVVESMRRDIVAAGHRLDILRLDANQGTAGARNAGIAAAQEGLIAFLDQDDTWPKERTAVLHTALRRTGSDLAHGHMALLDVMPGLHRPWVRDDWFGSSHIGTVMGAILCKVSVFEQVGLLDGEIRTGYDDVDWFSRIRDADLRIVLEPSVVVERKVHDRNQSRRSAAGQSDMFAIVRAHLGRASRAGNNT